MKNLWIYIGAVVVALGLGAAIGRFGATLGVVLLAVAILAVLLKRIGDHPGVLLSFLLFLVVLGQLGRIPPGAQGSAALVSDGVAGVLFMVWLAWFIANRQTITWRPALMAWTAFMAISLIMLVLTPLMLPKKEIVLNSYYWFRLLFYGSITWILPTILTKEKEQAKLMGYWIVSGVAVALLGFVQLYVLPDLGPLHKYGWDPHVGRLVSTFLDPNFLGGYLALILALLSARFILHPHQPFWFWLAVLAILVAAVLTFSRSGYLAILLVLAAAGFRYSWKLLLIGTVCLVPLGLTIPRVQERIAGGFAIDGSASLRIQSWSTALDIINYYPVLGVGYNNYQEAQEAIGALDVNEVSHAVGASDSSLLNVEATTGIIGLFCFLVAIACVLRDAARRARQKGGVGQEAALALLIVAPALFVHTWFVNGLFFPFILIPLTILIGLMYADAV